MLGLDPRMLGLNCLISSVSGASCYSLAAIVDGDHNIDLEVGCAGDYVLFLMEAKEHKTHI